MMATLISVHNSEGCVGRCDAKCYEATSPDCDCICGGANHGAGLDRAQANTAAMCEEWIERYTGEQGLTRYTAYLGESAQPDLFGSAQ